MSGSPGLAKPMLQGMCSVCVCAVAARMPCIDTHSVLHSGEDAEDQPAVAPLLHVVGIAC